MLIYKIIYIYIIIFKVIININCNDDSLIITKINPGFTNVTWYNNTQYLYYIDIQNYYIQEENIIEFIVGYRNVIEGTSISLLTTNQTEEQIINGLLVPQDEDEDKEKLNNIKKRLSSDLYLYGNVFKKTSNDQTFHIISFVPKTISKSLNIQISLSNRIKNYTLTSNNFTNNPIIRQTLEVRRNVEDFYKFILEDISVKDQNILFFIKEFNIACFYDELKFKYGSLHSNRLYMIEKNSTNKLNHVIYLSLIGEAGYINLEISILKNDIFFLNDSRILPFYIENIKYNEDIYIIENFENSNSIDNNRYDLDITPFYGNYTLTYYNTYNTTNIEELFIESKSTIIDKKINKVSGTSNFYRLSCYSPCAIKFGYIYYKSIKTLKEGNSVIKYISKNDVIKEIYDLDIKINNKKYYIFFELYGDEEIHYNTDNIAYYLYSGLKIPFQLNKNNIIGSKVVNIPKSQFFFETYSISSLIKFYLTSNLLYDNLVEGLNIINYNASKYYAFKMRRDILYDFVFIEIYSHKSYNISINYDTLIFSSRKISGNGRVLCEAPIKGENDKKRINLKYSNPYNKYNNKIKENEHMYITFFINTRNKKRNFPIYFSIKYYYNNTVNKIPYKEPKILKSEEEYKIVADNDFNKKNNLIININKCNLYKNYSFHTVYENINNIIWKHDITEKRNIILHNNIFNNSNIIFNEIIEKNNSNFHKKYINSIIPTNYLTNDDIYLNYFTINERLTDFKITNDYSLKYENIRGNINLKWSPYIYNNRKIKELTIQYDIYIFPENSKVNSICQMSLIPPNYTVINKNNYDLDIPKGKYKVNIIASVINEEFPLVTIYDLLEIQVSIKMNIIIIIILSFSFGILIIFIIIYFCYMKNKNKNNKIKLHYNRDSFWISLVEQRESNNKGKKDKNKNKKKISLFNEDDEDYIFKDDN